MTLETLMQDITVWNGRIKAMISSVHNDGKKVGNDEGYASGIHEGELAVNAIISAQNQYSGASHWYGETLEESRDNAIANIPKMADFYEESGRASGFIEGTAFGRERERSDFWDEFQDNGNRKNYRNAFWFSCWTQENYNPQHDFIVENGNEMFRYSLIENTVKTLDFSAAGTTSLRVFGNATKLKSIPSLVVSETVTFSNWFENCTALTEITMSGAIGNDFDIRWAPLTKASIESIVGCLSSTASGKTLTLNKEAVNAAFVIYVDDEASYPVGSEYYNLRHSRDNWNFNYI